MLDCIELTNVHYIVLIFEKEGVLRRRDCFQKVLFANCFKNLFYSVSRKILDYIILVTCNKIIPILYICNNILYVII